MTIRWQEYEGAVLEHLRQEFACTAVRVIGSAPGQPHTVMGRYSRAPRQLDVAAYGSGEERPFLIADAKRHNRRIDVRHVECFIGMADDIGVKLAALIAPEGFTRAAGRRAKAASMRLQVLTIEEAKTCQWLSLARRLYPYDWIFRRELAKALRLLDEGAGPADLVDALYGVAFEEWEALVRFAIAHHPRSACQFLLAVAAEHPDDSWRYNAVQRLLDTGSLDDTTRSRLVSAETDPEVLGLLQAGT